MTERKTNNSFLTHLRPRSVPQGAISILYTFCLGGLSFLSFLVLCFTGLLLMFRYQPGEQNGFSSIVELASVVTYGFLFRNIHFWAGQLMVVSVGLHMVRVVWTKSYKPLKQLNWVIGVILLLLTFVLDFTGYLLRGSQESGAAATVAVHILGDLPVVGSSLAYILFGNPSPESGSTLNVYVWHCVGLSFVALALQAYHFWRIRRDGGVRPL